MALLPLDQDPYPLHWVDEYLSHIKSFVYVRPVDRLLIKLPNEAFKLNAAGVAVLKALLSGVSLARLLEEVGDTPEKRRDLYFFFIALKRTLQGCLDESPQPGLQRVPFKLPFNTRPVLSEVALTYRCNLRCLFCYADCSSPPRSTEMTTRQVQLVLQKIRSQAEVPSVSFTGGEPTLRPDLVRLVAYARKIGLRVNLITNGTRLTAKLAHRLAKAGLASAQVSLEGTSAAVHESLTQVKGSFAQSLAGIAHLQKAGIRVHPHSTINQRNQQDLLNFPQFVQAHGWQRFSMNLIIPAGTATTQGRSLLISYASIGKYLVQLQRRARQANVEFMWYSPTPLCLFNPIAHGLGNKGCSACDGLLSIAPNGDVLPCSSYAAPVGNLLTQDFMTIWQSPRALFFQTKQYAPAQCRQCQYFVICNCACPLYWNHCGYEELSLAPTETGTWSDQPVPVPHFNEESI